MVNLGGHLVKPAWGLLAAGSGEGWRSGAPSGKNSAHRKLTAGWLADIRARPELIGALPLPWLDEWPCGWIEASPDRSS